MTVTIARLEAFKSSWHFDRGLSLDLLRSLSDADLLWSPGESVGPFWKQFRHIGRVQENYIDAIRTGVVKFSCDNSKYDGGANGAALADYLKRLDEKLLSELEKTDLDKSIDWFGEPVDVFVHLWRLSSHEVLHNGQWIVYCKLMGKNFPESWSIWGL